MAVSINMRFLLEREFRACLKRLGLDVRQV